MNASVVVLHYGRHDLTDTCLDSIGDDVEVVLVDNDPGYRHDRVDLLIRPRKNTGYAKGCNLGAAVASGDVLVFLNNDTVCHPGWLDALLAGFDEPRVGIVGAQLRYPDGSVQHAGVDIYRDAHGTLTGAHADVSLFDVRRDVRAVTGACMAVHRQCWLQLGGFDEGFWNGYEDVDFCLRATAGQWVIRYEPDAVVTHHESASGPERWVKVRENIARLNDKWPEEA